MLRIISSREMEMFRGDVGSFVYKIPSGVTEQGVTTYYEFQPGDIIKLDIFELKSDHQTPLKEIVTEVESETESVTINISSTDSQIGEPSPKAVEYAFEISLNDINTTTGYDTEEGEAIFRIKPAKASDV